MSRVALLPSTLLFLQISPCLSEGAVLTVGSHDDDNLFYKGVSASFILVSAGSIVLALIIALQLRALPPLAPGWSSNISDYCGVRYSV